MQQTIRFVKAPGGVRLAVGVSGGGPPIIKAANWLSHLEFDWHSPVWRHWFQFFSSTHQLMRYDPRGCGLSDWEVDDLCQARQLEDLEAVIDAMGLERFPLLGISQGGATCIEYAVKHPERVSKLILYGAYAEGWAQRGEEARRAGMALVELIRQGWWQDNPAFRQLFGSLFIPDANAEQIRWFSDLMRTTTRPEIAARIFESFGNINVRSSLSQVKVPTIVIHARGDARIPLDQGRLLAAEISGAQFVTLEGRNHILIEAEAAWEHFKEAFNEFLGVAAPSARPEPARLDELTARENGILHLVALGHGNADIAQQLFISEKTVRNHLTSIFEKLGVDSRARAIIVARDRGL